MTAVGNARPPQMRSGSVMTRSPLFSLLALALGLALWGCGTPSPVGQRVPDFTEVFAGADGEYRILRYRTHRTTSDGDTTRDETTALVFLSGRLVGVGGAAVARLQ